MTVQKKLDALLGVRSAQADPSLPEAFSARALRSDKIAHKRSFSAFISDDLDQALDLAQDFVKIADRAIAVGATKEEALDGVLNFASGVADTHRGMVQHALKVFITHHDAGRVVRLPSLMRRMKTESADAEHPPIGGRTTSADEDKLNWFREDPLANEHHEHWHVVYPSGGIPDSSGGRRVKDRHGELFFYMHQQMLARYDAERLGAGLKRVAPFDNYRSPIEVGYFPGKLVVGDEAFEHKGRSANAAWTDLPAGALGASREYSISLHEDKRDAFLEAVRSQSLLTPGGTKIPLTGKSGSDLLGATSEVSRGGVDGLSRDAWTSRYGNHHGFGHVLTAWASDSPAIEDWGVMFHEYAAIRDPIFWQWHKHIDMLNSAYQESLPPNEFTDAPSLRFVGSDEYRSSAITLLSTDFGMDANAIHHAVLTASTANNESIALDSEALAKSGLSVTDEIVTELRDGVFKLSNGESYSYKYLWHESFAYLFHVTNSNKFDINATFRVFLCPMEKATGLSSDDAWLSERSLWIELDKFSRIIPAQSVTVVAQPDDQSSVIRRPAIRSPQSVEDIVFDPNGEPSPSNHYCECGWPYHLLVPKGKEEGMAFALLVMATDGEIDRVGRPGTCGSISFCGVKDQYPDTRAMGYPFDRPLNTSVADIVRGNVSFAMRRITIRHRAASMEVS